MKKNSSNSERIKSEESNIKVYDNEGHGFKKLKIDEGKMRVDKSFSI